ncbi:MAG: hypothetical protein K2O67_05520 [Clostridia bacterium]|nr:hypothetical protein [Clostridia bacterium]
MNTLTLTIGNMPKGCRVYADGKQIELEKNATGGLIGQYCTEKDTAEIIVSKVPEVACRFWFLWAMLFFIISCFGIFNSRYEKKGHTVQYRASVKLNTITNMRLEFNLLAEGQRAVSCGSDGEVEEYENIFYTDLKAKKRFKLLTLAEVFLWLALIAILAVVIVKKIIG